jgi:hypothetical protein
MGKKFQTLESWIEEALSDQDKMDALGNVKACTALAAVHVSANGVGTKSVHAIPLTGKTHTPASLANKLIGKIQGFAQDLGQGPQQFLVHAFYGSSEPEATHPIRTLDGDMVSGDDWGRVSETPNEKGITAQLMRHLEHKDNMLMTVLQGTFGSWAKERHELQAEVNESYKIVREMMMNMESARHTQAMEREQYARTSQERKALMAMIPALANGLTGKEIFPKESADTALLDAMARRMTPDMVDAAVQMGIIPKEAHGAVVARIVEVREREIAEQRELARVPPASRSGADDVQGN